MPFTVSDALNLKVFEGHKILAGHGSLARQVSSVSVVEVPDVWRWMNGEEMLLTTMYPFKDSVDSQVEFVRQIASKQVSCLVVKTGRFIDAVPPEVVSLADDVGLPVVELPHHISFVDVINSVVGVVMGFGLDVMQQSEKLKHEALNMVREGQNLHAIVTFASNCLRNPVSLHECDGTLIALAFDESASNVSSALPQMTAKALATLAETSGPLLAASRMEGKRETVPKTSNQPLLVVTSSTDKETYGYLVVWDGGQSIPEAALKAADSFAFAVALEMARQRVSHEVERKYVRQFIRQLVSGGLQEEVARQQGEQLGIKLGGTSLVLVLPTISQRAESVLHDSVKPFNPDSEVCLVGEELVVIWPLVGCEDPSLQDMKSALAPWFGHLQGKVSQPPRVCVGKPALRASEIPVAYETARKCLTLLKAVTEEKAMLVFFSELGLMRLLALCPSDELKRFRWETLGPILEYDLANQGNLEDSLYWYLQGGNLRWAAKKLIVHPNTMKYRLAKISTMLRVDLDDISVRATLWAALMIEKFAKGYAIS